MIIITLGEILFMPTSQNLAYQYASVEQNGYYMGIYQAIYASTFLLTPLLSGFLLSYNPRGLLLWVTSLCVSAPPYFIFS